MSDESTLLPVEQKNVSFYDDEIIAVRASDGAVYVPIRPICDNLGVTLAGQRERINRDPVLSELVTSVSVTLTQQAREMLCLPLNYIPGWLFGISADRVKPELRDKIIRYQKECFNVLAEAFVEGRLTAEQPFDQLLAGASPETIQAYQVAQAVLQLARNQVMLEARLRGVLDDHELRLEAVEAQLRLGSARYVTEDQASQISQAVKAVALAAGKKSGRNEFGAVYGELYRKFGITGYKMLPARRFDEAMKFLTEWHENLTGTLPF